MKKYFTNVMLVILLGLGSFALQGQVSVYTTTADQSQKFKKLIVEKHKITSKVASQNVTIEVNTNTFYQKMEGFGFAMTGGSATLIHQLPLEKQQSILNEIFGHSSSGLGVSYLRVSIGASDLDESVFSYCDLPKGQIDTSLVHFSLAKDTVHLIPILKKALQINPSLKIMASPWSPPTWMKSNDSSVGGHLLQKYYSTYADYFVKYIKAMNAQGINIHSVTIQNEPEHGGNNPSMLMNAQEQTEFVRDHLGPKFKQAKIETEIVIWDHNADHPNYPITVLNDPKARQFIAASAFHLYLGEEAALSEVHKAHPDKKLYFTEQWTGAKGSFDGDFMWHLEHIVIGTIQNWSSLVLEWNIASDAAYNPHTPGGCTECKGAFMIQGDKIKRNVSYYIIGQIAKYVPSGAVRIETKSSDNDIKTIGFKLPSGKKVLLILNKTTEKQIGIRVGSEYFTINMPSQSASTLVW